MDPATFLTELKRRKIYRVAVAYAIVAWLLIQAASILFPTFEAPPWVMKVFVAVLILGFPIVLIFSWAFEITPRNIHVQKLPPLLYEKQHQEFRAIPCDEGDSGIRGRAVL